MICQFRGSWHTYPPFVFKLFFESLVFSHVVYFVMCTSVCGIKVLQGDKLAAGLGSASRRRIKNSDILPLACTQTDTPDA